MTAARSSRTLLVSLLFIALTALAPTHAVGCQWALMALAKTARLFRGPSQFWKDPRWVREGILKKENGRRTLNLPLHSSADIHGFPIIGYSRRGNPIIRMTADSSVFIPSQTDLKNFRRYAEKQSNLERVTYAKPIEAKVYLGDDSHKPQFVVEDGHHRFYGAYRTGSAIYVEISGFTFWRPRTLSWDQLEF